MTSFENSESANTAPILSVNNLTVRYPTARGWVNAINNVSFKLDAHKFLGIAGESGSGKSTLVMACLRILDAERSDVTGSSIFLGDNIFDMTEEELRQRRWRDVSFVTQSAMNALNPILRVREQMRDTFRAHVANYSVKQADARAEEVFRMVNLDPVRLDSYPHQLSGGMRQRAVIAMALLLKPELIVMDEPTTALDVVVQKEILSLIKRLQIRLGFSVILITHDLSLLLEMADDIIVLYGGRVMESAPVRSFVARPVHPYSRALLHSFPPLHGAPVRREGIPGSPPDMASPLPGCPFAPRCTEAIAMCHTVVPLLKEWPKDGRLVACHVAEQDNSLDKGGGISS